MLIRKDLLDNLLQLVYMNAQDNGHWIIVKPHGEDSKGTHLFVEDGESNKEAVERKFRDGHKKENPISDFISEGYKVTPYFKSPAAKMKDRSWKLYKGNKTIWSLKEGEKELTRNEYVEGLKLLADKIGEYKLVTNKNKDNIKEPRYEVYHKNKLIAHAFGLQTAKKL